MELSSITFRIKSGDTTFSTSDIKPQADNDSLLRFGGAYTALQGVTGAAYTVRKVYTAV